MRTALVGLALCALLIGVARGQEGPSDEAVERNNRGAALLQQGKLEQAVAEFQRAVEMAPASAAVQANLAFAYEQQGRTDEAIAAYRKVLELEPGNVLARNNLGNLLSRNGLYGEAVREFEELLRRDPANATARGNLETAKRNVALTQERRDAIASAVKASEARPADPGAAYNTARLYALYGDHDKALAWLAAALELGYEQTDFLSVDPSLVSLRKDPRFAKFLQERGVQSAQPR